MAKLSCMTGTAATEAEALQKIYKLDVLIIHTNKNMIRLDHPDVVFKTTKAKYSALANLIAELNSKGQPVLVGTTSIEKNEVVSNLLKHRKIPHQVLNAKNHEKEAVIISEAGRIGSVTIATNIAGRGVDIILGGTPPPNPKFVLGKDRLTDKQYEKEMAVWQKAHNEVVNSGGLYVIGTDRHESRRIDNQLRGRSGRQGDPGATKFFLSLDDDIMRIFGGEQVQKIMNFLKIPEDEPIEHGMVSKAIEQAQVKVEGFNFDARKHVVDYDDVMNKQREIVYGLRHRVLNDEITDQEIVTKLQSMIKNTVEMYAPRGIVESETLPITTALVEIIPFDDTSQKSLSDQFTKLGTDTEIINVTNQIIADAFKQRKIQLGDENWIQVVRYAYLSAIDHLWVEHLDAVDDLRSGIGLRGYGQRDPLVEYKAEAFNMFERLVSQIDSEFSKRLFRIQIGEPREASRVVGPKVIEIKPEIALPDAPATNHKPLAKGQSADFLAAMQGLQKGGVSNTAKSLGRNDPCPCGSGKKWKKCHYPNIP
jgi:preprotein translocase subunit SecA